MKFKILKKINWNLLFIFLLIFLSFSWFIYGQGINSYFSTDDFAVLAYYKSHSLISTFKFFVSGDIFGFNKFLGFLIFGTLFKLFGVNNLPFDLTMFVTHTLNLVLLFILVKKLSKNSFAAFFVSVIFNKNYLFYYSNIHENLLALLAFLTIYLFISYPKKFYISLITFLLALTTKETAVTIPLVLLGLSFVYKLDRKKIYLMLLLSLIYGIYLTGFFVNKNASIPNLSYKMSFNFKEVLSGILFYVNIKMLLLFSVLPFLTKKLNTLPLFFLVLASLIPASLLVNRRESYYFYLPLGYLLIYLSLFSPKLTIKTSFIYLFIFFVLGARSTLPLVARQTFPNWQKESMFKVVNRVEENLGQKQSVYIGDINLERDAKLMLESGTLDLFLEKDLVKDYNFTYRPEVGFVEVNIK